MNELAHMAIEGLFAVLMAVAGLLMKSLWGAIERVRVEKDQENKELREKLEKIRETANALELRVEREFVKHSDLTWIKDKLEEMEKLLQQVRLAMERHRRADEPAE